MRLVILGIIATAVAACASIGRPEGGPKDELPPEYVRSNPAPGTTNFNKTTIEVFFNENIKLEDASNKFIVSPAQQQMPQISANGKKLTVHLRDSLLPDQTYTLDFSDAIRDLNEGNILDGFVIDFATGDHLDSLRIAGMVLEAQTLEPAQGIIIGAYRNFADSAIRTLKVERIGKTNQYGQFTLRNLKSDYYRLFAINDVNRDYHWDRSEDIAFYDQPIKPWCESFTVIDTLRASDGSDSVATRPGIRFFPNDVLMVWFNENYKSLYMKDHSREVRNILKLEFSAPVDSLPILTVVNGVNEGKRINDYSVLNRSAANDSLQFWLTDSALIMQDSLLIETRYLKTDSNDMITWTTDTMRYFFKLSRAAEKELEKKAEEKVKKEKKRQEAIAKFKETGDSSLIKDTIPEVEPIEYLEIKALTGTTQDYHKPVRISFSEPLKDWDVKTLKMEWMVDSAWRDLEDVQVFQDTAGRIMEYIITRPWEFETQYRITIDSAAITSIYDKWNKGFKHEFKVKSPEDYSTLVFDIPNSPYRPAEKFNWDSLANILHADSIDANDPVLFPDSIVQIEQNDSLSVQPPVIEIADSIATTDSVTVNIVPDSVFNSVDTVFNPGIIVELLSSKEDVVARVPVKDGKATFLFLSPGTYFARAFIDFNGNGIWDTGSIEEWRQPEDMYYYPKKLTLKQNWDMSQTWDLFETPLDIQKPLEIKKNKPKTKDGQNTNTEDDEDGEDDFGNNYFYQPGNAYVNGGNAAGNNRQRNGLR